MNRKGIILAGGSASRLYPITKYISKHLLPVYDKPMINYPLSVLMLAGIKDILIISTKKDLFFFKDYLGNGGQYGANFSYLVQENPNGLAEAFIIGEPFIKDSSVALILGDNIFYGSNLAKQVFYANKSKENTIFLKQVTDPERFGVATIDKKTSDLVGIQEKPIKPKSDLAVTGLYFYDNSVIKFAKQLKPSARGELEITDINNIFIKKKKLKFITLSRATIWKDAGTFDSLIEASNIIKQYQNNFFYIGLLEEVAIRNRWISYKQINHIKNPVIKNYLKNLK
jgi:glucose-1-phosphate thymidylyltransferase